jgi:hypothetical protein
MEINENLIGRKFQGLGYVEMPPTASKAWYISREGP